MEGGSVITGLDRLETHLQVLLQLPETVLDPAVFDEVELQLTDSNTPPLTLRLLPVLIRILTTYQNEPSILASFSLKLLKPVPFTQALTLASESALMQALRSTAPSMNILAIAVIEKAAGSPADIAILSAMRDVVEGLLRAWLSTPYVEVGERAGKALMKLLHTDRDHKSVEVDTEMRGLQISPRIPPGQGLLWRRILQDREIYSLILELCSFRATGSAEGQLDERQKSLAQARLLRVLPQMAALDFSAISRANFPEVEREYGLQEGELGLLWFAAAKMANKEGDILMHITVIDFFVELLAVISLTDITPKTMEYLARLLREVTSTDTTMHKSLESIVVNPDSSSELVDLLIRLGNY